MTRVLALGAGLALASCSAPEVKEQPAPKSAALETSRTNSRACASSTVYERIKAQAFEQAAAIHGGRSTMLDRLSGQAIVRMDSPFVKGVDPAIGVTICGGTFIVELPPGFNDLFDGDRRIAADVEYASQPAADGSGLVFRMTGAEPVIYRLAAVALRDDAKDLPPAALETQAPVELAAAPEPVAPVVETPKLEMPKPVAIAAKPVEKKAKPVSPEPSRLAEAKAKPAKLGRTLAKLELKNTESKKAEAKKLGPKTLALAKAAPKPQPKKPMLVAKAAPKAEPKKLAVKPVAPPKSRSLLNATFGKSLRETARGEATPVKAVAEPPSKPTPKPVARVAAPCSVGSTAERLLCADRALAAKDRRVRQVYSRTFASLPPEGRRALRATAARFESYRANCRTAGCMSSAYDERHDEIDEIAADYGG